MALATLSIDLEARLASLQEGFDKAARLAEKNANLIEARYNKLSSAAAGIGAAFASVVSVAGLSAFFRATVDGLDALNDLSDATGASIENLSALEALALRTGTSFDTVSSALVKLNQGLGDADPDSPVARSLKRIGLNAQELRTLDPAEALRRLAVTLAGYADDGNKARLVQELFGKSVREVAPLLKDLAEAGELNATVTKEQAEAAERFNKQLAQLSAGVTDAGRALAGDLLPGINKALEGFTKLLTMRVSFGAIAGEVLKGNTFSDAAEGANFYSEKLATLQRQYALIAESSKGVQRRGALIDLSAEIEQVERLRNFYRYFQTRELPQASYSNEGRLRLPSLGPEPAKVDKPKAKRYEFVGPELDPVTEAALKRIEDTETRRLARLREQLRRLLEIGGPDVGSSEAVQDLLKDIERLDPAQRAAAASRARLNQLMGETPSGRLQEAIADIDLINDAYARGAITVEQWAELARATTAKLPEQTAKALDELDEYTREFQRNVQNVLGDNIASVLQGDFDNIGQAWKNMLIRMAAEAAAADLAGRLFGKDGRGGLVGNLFDFFGGGYAKGGAFIGGAQITAFADGGVLNRPTYFGMSGGRVGLAGEAGAEGVFPLERGPDGRLGVKAYGGRGGDTYVYHVAAGVTRGELLSALQMVSQQTEARVMAQLSARRVI